MKHKGFIEIEPGLWYEEATGLPWSSKYFITIYDEYSRRIIGRKLKTDGELNLLTCKNRNGYYMLTTKNKLQTWHRLVYKFFYGKIPKDKVIDHINNLRDDNRIENLRITDREINIRCHSKYKSNSSGFSGVSLDRSKYRARIHYNNKNISLGHYNTKEEAYQAYLQAKIKYHGEDSIRVLDKI